MEWLYGLLIGSTFTAVLMHLAHRGHKEEGGRDAIESSTTLPADRFLLAQAEPKVTEPWSQRLPYVEAELAGRVAAHYERGDAVDSLDDVSTYCSCSWHGDQNMCEAEPSVWYRTTKDPKCEVHGSNDAWLLRHYANRPGGY